MKRFKIFFLLFALFFIACKKEKSIEDTKVDVIPSNNYYLVETSSQWTVRREWQQWAPFPYDDYYGIDTTIFYFDGDTSLSRLTVFDFDSISNYPIMNKYNKLHYLKKAYVWNLSNEDPSSSPGTLTTTTGTAAYIRQDTLNKIVYVARAEDSFFPMLTDDKEYILYDFNLKCNDALPYNAWNGGITNRYTVDTLEYMMVDGKNLKVFKVYENNYYYCGTIIEGIGSIQSFLRNNDKLIHFKNSEIEFYP